MLRLNSQMRFRCSNGHKIRASVRRAGKTISCPACGVPVVVGGADDDKVLTESGVCRILTEIPDIDTAQISPRLPATQPVASTSKLPAVVAILADASETTPLAPVPMESQQTTNKGCPRCSIPVPAGVRVCPECRLLLESTRSVFRRLYRAASRSFR